MGYFSRINKLLTERSDDYREESSAGGSSMCTREAQAALHECTIRARAGFGPGDQDSGRPTRPRLYVYGLINSRRWKANAVLEPSPLSLSSLLSTWTDSVESKHPLCKADVTPHAICSAPPPMIRSSQTHQCIMPRPRIHDESYSTSPFFFFSRYKNFFFWYQRSSNA